MQDAGLEPNFDVSFLEASPTLTHMSLVSLQTAKYLKYLISQNVRERINRTTHLYQSQIAKSTSLQCDGLHIRSGIKRGRHHMSLIINFSVHQHSQ